MSNDRKVWPRTPAEISRAIEAAIAKTRAMLIEWRPLSPKRRKAVRR